jgi:hypothetical protein
MQRAQRSGSASPAAARLLGEEHFFILSLTLQRSERSEAGEFGFVTASEQRKGSASCCQQRTCGSFGFASRMTTPR